MNREEFEAFAKDRMEEIRAAWNQFCAGTAWEGRNYPLCISIFRDSVYAFCMDDDREYIVNVYELHT